MTGHIEDGTYRLRLHFLSERAMSLASGRPPLNAAFSTAYAISLLLQANQVGRSVTLSSALPANFSGERNLFV